MIMNSRYESYDDWTASLESENKQLFISANEIDDQNQKFALRALKKEKPAKTLILLTTETANYSLLTIPEHRSWKFRELMMKTWKTIWRRTLQ